MTCFLIFGILILYKADKFSKNTDKVISKNCNNTQTPYVVTQHQQHSQYTKFNVPILNKLKSNYLYYAISNIVS